MKKVLPLVYICLFFVAGMAAERYLVPKLKRFFYKPVVSVVLSTYNRAHTLPTAVESILNQTFRDFELILIDDGSTDNTWEIIQSYARKDPRIFPLKNNKNQGLTYSLNRGLDAARGKYIARMDDDDKSVLYRLEREVAAMEAHPEITVLGSQMLWKDTPLPPKSSNQPKITNPDYVELDSYFRNPLYHPTIIMRRDFLEQNHIRYNPKYLYAEDMGLYKDILNKGGKITTMNENLLYYAVFSNLNRPSHYYSIQEQSFQKVQKEKLAPFIEATPEYLGNSLPLHKRCVLLTQMSEKNPQLKILNQTLLDQMKNDICSKSKAIQKKVKVTHPNWSDHIQINPDGKTFHRVSIPAETGKIVREDKKSVTVKWDRWGEETFLKAGNGKKWTFKNP